MRPKRDRSRAAVLCRRRHRPRASRPAPLGAHAHDGESPQQLLPATPRASSRWASTRRAGRVTHRRNLDSAAAPDEFRRHRVRGIQVSQPQPRDCRGQPASPSTGPPPHPPPERQCTERRDSYTQRAATASVHTPSTYLGAIASQVHVKGRVQALHSSQEPVHHHRNTTQTPSHPNPASPQHIRSAHSGRLLSWNLSAPIPQPPPAYSSHPLRLPAVPPAQVLPRAAPQVTSPSSPEYRRQLLLRSP